eukprot:1138593-Alexandrium_andersonii.AAC.1
MSASLVGSEMCIRDRNMAHGHLTRPRAFHTHRAEAPTGPNGRTSGLQSPCLLYTSDAADDM